GTAWLKKFCRQNAIPFPKQQNSERLVKWQSLQSHIAERAGGISPDSFRKAAQPHAYHCSPPIVSAGRAEVICPPDCYALAPDTTLMRNRSTCIFQRLLRQAGGGGAAGR